jgi:hypothetical protein
VDIVAGNLGLNSYLKASEREPVTMYVKDFIKNGFTVQIVSQYTQGKSYPIVLRDDLIRSLPYLKARYRLYQEYAGQSVTDIFEKADLADAVFQQANTFATSVARNTGGGGFTLEPLPREAQMAPVFGIASGDFDGDGISDLLLAGNFDGFKPDIAQMHATTGTYLHGLGKGRFEARRGSESGFHVQGQARDILRVRTASGPALLVTRNNEGPALFHLSQAVPTP